MRFEHPEHPGRSVRLAYCLNLHPAEDLDGVLEGMRTITLPLRERLGVRGSLFGVGPWLPASVAMELTREEGSPDLDRFVEFFAENELDPFTYNAFPYGGFHQPGLKSGVFRPTWAAAERLAFTISVAQIAQCLHEVCGGGRNSGHISISTHSGGYAADLTAAHWGEITENFCLLALNLSKLEDESGDRIVCAIEPEPRSAANDTRELAGLHERILAAAPAVIGGGQSQLREVAEDIVRHHIGTCLDACHAAVEFEAPDEAFRGATSGGAPLGKLQFSSALVLDRPDENHTAREHFLALDEPVYLHQVTGQKGDLRPRIHDLGPLAEAYTEGASEWRDCDEWRCHFHVPVDLQLDSRAKGLRTTRPEADATLQAALSAPERWGSMELHVEIETYTWNVLDPSLRGPGALLEGLEREYRHVLERLDHAGWKLVGGGPKKPQELPRFSSTRVDTPPGPE